MLQLIDGEAYTFISQEKYTEAWSLISRSEVDKMVVIAIIGGQCGGKSTLLNLIFGSSFKVLPPQDKLRESESLQKNDFGQIQTTKGTWLTYKEENLQNNMPPVILIDNEGSDGSERYGDTLFEFRSSLFCFSVSDILIINIWAAEVGRFTAGNISLLRTIFHLRLALFGVSKEGDGESRKILLFVLRDHVSGTISQHTENITKSLTNVWREVLHSIPQDEYTDFKNTDVHQVFDIKVLSMPHYLLQKELFDSKLNDARKTLSSLCKEMVLSENGAQVLSDSPRRLTNFSVDSLYNSMQSCWGLIMQSKDLDMSTHNYLVAAFFCEEVKRKRIMPMIDEKRNEWLNALQKSSPITGIELEMDDLCRASMEKFRSYVAHYPLSITEESALSLRDNTLLNLKMNVFSSYMNFIVGDIKEELSFSIEEKLEKSMCMHDDAWPNFNANLHELRENNVHSFLRMQVSKGSITDPQDQKISADNLFLYTMVEEELEGYILKEVHRNLKKMCKIEKVSDVMCTVFTEAYEHHLKMNCDKGKPCLSDHITAAKLCFPCGIQYLQNVLVNQATFLKSQRNRLRIDYCVNVKEIGEKDESIENCTISFEVLSIKLILLESESPQEIVEPENSSVENEKIIHIQIFPDAGDTDLKAIASCKNLVISNRHIVEQAFRLYAQSITHEIQVNFLQRRLAWEQYEQNKKKKTLRFLTEIPLWFWVIFFYFVIDDVFHLMTGSVFWIVVFLFTYTYLSPLNLPHVSLQSISNCISSGR